MPTIQGQLKSDGNVNYAAFVLAAWAKYSLGVNEKNETINIKDALAEKLLAQAKIAKDKPAQFLTLEEVFGNLSQSVFFCEAFTKAYRNIESFGVEKCILEMNSNF